MPRSEAAAKSVAKLFAPADVEKMPAAIAPLQQGSMLTVVVGTTFHGYDRARAAAAGRRPTREPAHVDVEPVRHAEPLRGDAEEGRFKLMVPTVIESSSAPDSTKPIYAYRIDGDHKAVRLVFRTAGGAYWGIEETDWDGRAGPRRPELPPRARRPRVRLLLQRPEAAHDRAAPGGVPATGWSTRCSTTSPTRR